MSLSSQALEENFLDLGKSLRQLLDRDPDMFKKVVDATDLGTRKAYYLVNISNWFDPLAVSKKRLLAIGWTKLEKIGKHVTKQNVDELLTLAETSNVKQLEAHMRGETPPTNAACVLMYFDQKNYKLLEDVLVQHGGGKRSGRGIENKEEALVRVLRKFKKLTADEE